MKTFDLVRCLCIAGIVSGILAMHSATAAPFPDRLADSLYRSARRAEPICWRAALQGNCPNSGGSPWSSRTRQGGLSAPSR